MNSRYLLSATAATLLAAGIGIASTQTSSTTTTTTTTWSPEYGSMIREHSTTQK